MSEDRIPLRVLMTRLNHDERFLVLARIADLVTDGYEYWKAMRHAWETAELLSPYQDSFPDLFHRHYGCHKAFMDLPERRFLRDLPGLITIYRGTPLPEQPGWSWTLDHTRAEMFARRWPMNDEAYLLRAVARAEDVFGYLDARGEEEIVIEPMFVQREEVWKFWSEPFTAEAKLTYMVRTGQLGINDHPFPMDPGLEPSVREWIRQLRLWTLDDIADKWEVKLHKGMDMYRQIQTASTDSRP